MMGVTKQRGVNRHMIQQQVSYTRLKTTKTISISHLPPLSN